MNRLFKTLLLALLIPVCTYASGWNDEEWYQTLPIGSHLLGRIGMLELLTMHLRIQGYRLGLGQGLRPQLINFVRSKRILIKDVTLLNSPFWVIHPLLCKNITVLCASSYSQKHSSRKRYKFLIDKHLNRWRVIPHSSPLIPPMFIGVSGKMVKSETESGIFTSKTLRMQQKAIERITRIVL